VEDLIVAVQSLDGVQMVKDSVSVSFEVRDRGKVNDFIGMKIMRDRAANVITLSNPRHLTSLLEAFQMDMSAPHKTPMVSGAELCKTGENLLPEGNRYAELIGSLLYLSATKRPDIAFFRGLAVPLHVMPRGEPHARGQEVAPIYSRRYTPRGRVRRRQASPRVR